MVKVGIFWVIGGKVFPYVEERESDKLNEREKISGKIDSNFEHFTQWDKELAKKFPYADFATYPRGRVMYDAAHNRHVVYADACIKSEAIQEIKRLYEISKCTVERDEHYRCDNCMRHKESPEITVEDCGDSYKVVVVSAYGAIMRTLDKSGGDEFAFEDILNETSVTERNSELVCEFTATERPSSEFSVFFSENTGVTPVYIIKDEITYKILDGENRIGANLIEVYCNNKRYLIECGTELEPTEEGIELRRKIAGTHYSACFITHYHGDHAGLLSEPLCCDAIYMGAATMRVLSEIGGICGENAERVVTFAGGDKISFNGMTVTPYLCDHSAYDSYMFHFKSESSSILYTGDFRANGRKSFDALLSQLPHKVDTIICEGTNMKNNAPAFTEKDLEGKLVEVFSGGPIFVLQSATNIDRIVSVYRAAVRTDRAFVMRLAQARICELLPNIPQPNGFKRCYTYQEFQTAEDKFEELQHKYGERLVGKKWLSKNRRFVLEVTSRDLSYIKRLSEMTDLTGATLVYSTWMGYTEREDMKAFLDGIKELGINIEYIHASGHADVATIEKLLNTIRHKEVQFVHKEP